mgnify:CR=1 FL=1
MNILDIIIAIPLLWALYRGFRKGLVYMIASVLALLFGILGAVRFHELTAGLLDSWFEVNPDHLKLLSFAVTFVAIVLIIHLSAFLVDKLIKAVALNFLNRLAGMAFGLFVTGFVISIILLPVQAANEQKQFISQEKIDQSLLYTPLLKFAPMVFPYLKKEEFREWLPLDRDNDTPDPGEEDHSPMAQHILKKSKHQKT